MTLAPVIVIGAARSGTKIIRDSLATATGAGVVPFDVGYVWRYGNENTPHDALTSEQVTPQARSFVRRFLRRYTDPSGLVVEKTVGNALRVDYVARIIPEARFVYVERDGVDVACSARREWRAPIDYRYLGRKLLHFPPQLAPSYGVKYLKAQLDRSEGHARTWGPRYPSIDEDLAEFGLLRVCARQWLSCVNAADTALAERPVARLTYSDLLADPISSVTRLTQELDVAADEGSIARAASMIDPKASVPARDLLDADERRILTEELADALEVRGYERP